MPSFAHPTILLPLAAAAWSRSLKVLWWIKQSFGLPTVNPTCILKEPLQQKHQCQISVTMWHGSAWGLARLLLTGANLQLFFVESLGIINVYSHRWFFFHDTDKNLSRACECGIKPPILLHWMQKNCGFLEDSITKSSQSSQFQYPFNPMFYFLIPNRDICFLGPNM